MARITLVEPEQAPPEVKEIYEQKLKGKPGNAQKAMAHRPEVLKNFLGFYASVGRSLERKLYELIYIRVSLINGCRYCLQHHLASSRRVGLTRGRLGRAQAGQLLELHREGAGSADLRREADAVSARNCRWGFQGIEEALYRSRNCRHSFAGRCRQPDQSVYRSSRAGAGDAGRKNLATDSHGSHG